MPDPTFCSPAAAPYWFSDFRYANLTERDMGIETFRSLPDYQRTLASLAHYLKEDGAQVVLVTEPSIYKAQMTREEHATVWINKFLCKVRTSRFTSDYPSAASMAAWWHQAVRAEAACLYRMSSRVTFEVNTWASAWHRAPDWFRMFPCDHDASILEIA